MIYLDYLSSVSPNNMLALSNHPPAPQSCLQFTHSQTQTQTHSLSQKKATPSPSQMIHITTISITPSLSTLQMQLPCVPSRWWWW
jgi:hypothetical protein